MNKQILHAIRILFGVILILIGISGLFLPILPGWILIFVGIELLGIQIVFVEQIKRYVKDKIDSSKKSK